MNPILPVQHFVPDPEARQWNDGRMYIYGSYDISGDTSYCSYELRVFSSDDLENWVDHGTSFRSRGPNSDVPWTECRLYAPDCICHNGTYYLFFCLADGSEGVATSKTPYGPFSNARPVAGAHGDGIDPAALVDDDGEVYLYWGQFHLRGARLTPGLDSIDPSTLCTNLINEAEHGFHEGASIRKRNGIYYLVYTDISRGRATCLSYAISRSPLGPFEKKGTIIDNTGCDPETWNNHGSIAEFNGNWYVFYHRSSQASNFSRRACIEPIYFNEDGTIDEVEMTTQGASGPMDARVWIDAYRACLLNGKVRTGAVELADTSGPVDTAGRAHTADTARPAGASGCANAFGTTGAAGQAGTAGTAGRTEALGLYSEHLTQIHRGDWAAYKYIDFGSEVSLFEARAGSRAYGGQIEVRLDDPEGPLVGTCEVGHTGGWQKWETVTCPIQSVSGVHAVYLVFKGRESRLFDLKSFRFR